MKCNFILRCVIPVPVYAEELVFLEDYGDKKPNFNLIRYISLGNYNNLYKVDTYFKLFDDLSYGWV